MLNGGKQHVFQSAMRATAKLHLLSPAVFPLPFGTKTPPVTLLIPTPRKEAAEAAAHMTDHVADDEVPIADGPTGSLDAKQTQRAKHTQQPSVQPVIASSAVVKPPSVATIQDKLAKDHQAAAAAGIDPTLSSQFGGKAVSQAEGAKAACTGKPWSSLAGNQAGQRQKLLTVGPVTKLVTNDTGLVIDHEEEAEQRPPSLGTVGHVNAVCKGPCHFFW